MKDETRRSFRLLSDLQQELGSRELLEALYEELRARRIAEEVLVAVAHDCGTCWSSTEPGLEGYWTPDGLKRLYDETVDKAEYPEFWGWLWDMERSGVFTRHE